MKFIYKSLTFVKGRDKTPFLANGSRLIAAKNLPFPS